MRQGRVPFGRPIQKQGDNIPPHLEGPKTAVLLQNATIDDFLWIGVDGQLDAQQIVEEAISPSNLLCYVLRAVIEAHPCGNLDPEKRLKTAMKSLTGRPTKLGRPKTTDYDKALNWMADRYIRGFFGFEEPAKSLNALAEQALRSTGTYPDDPEQQHTKRKKLREMFEKEKDRLLAVKTGDEYTLHAAKQKGAAAIKALADLEISVGRPDPARTSGPAARRTDRRLG